MIGWIAQIFTGGAVKGAIDAISDAYDKWLKRRATADAVDAKIRLAKVKTTGKLQLADHELQVLRTRSQMASWRDEYVTILVSIPIIIACVGALVGVWDENAGARLLEAAAKITAIMTGSTIDFAELWLIVVAVALGTKPLRR